MKTLIVILIILSFVESSVLPLDLVLIVLICRGYIRSDKSNLWLAFSFGLVKSYLSLTTMGINSLIYISLVALIQSLSKSRLAGNSTLIIPLSFILLFINQLVYLLIFHEHFLTSKMILESVLSLPILALVKFWEERFVVRKEIKLKV